MSSSSAVGRMWLVCKVRRGSLTCSSTASPRMWLTIRCATISLDSIALDLTTRAGLRLSIFAIALRARIRFATSWTVSPCALLIPLGRGLLCSPLLIFAIVLAEGYRSDDTAELFYSFVSDLILRRGMWHVPRSKIFPPLLVSNPSGALQVGQYCDSNSLIYS